VADLDRALRLLEPWRRLVSPVFLGIERIPARERPLLFVGNHTLLGLLDTPLLFAEVYRRTGVFLRGLGDHGHFKVPIWGDFLRRMGAVPGTREECARLMREGEAVLVFPGGGREVAKRRGEKYRLIWKERLGFARMALRHGCTIVPFAAIGVEDALDVVFDWDDLLASPLGPLVRKLRVRPEVVMPVVKGIGPTPLPRPERLYFHFGEAIPVARTEDTDEAARALRDRVKAAVEGGIAELHERRARDPGRTLSGRLRGRLLGR
jgi:1-acyl-sn-glycerol-3-phosphate acyltransferase